MEFSTFVTVQNRIKNREFQKIGTDKIQNDEKTQF